MNRLLDRPRLLALLCSAGAVGLGLAYMAAAGAPARYLLVNLAALILGASLWLALASRAAPRPGDGAAVLALSLPLLATARLGVPVEGASRWIDIGPLSVQVSLVLLPAMIVLYARRVDPLGTMGIAVAAFALAVQPDRAMAGVLAVSMAALLLTRPGRLPALALAAALAAFAAAMLLPDALPAVPFVDRILYTAFDVHPAAGLAVVAGCLLLAAPALAGALGDTGNRPALLAFGACWAAVAVAAALGDYPTPLVGYGGGAVLGYLLSAALLPASARARDAALPRAAAPEAAGSSGGDSLELAALEPA